MEARLEEREPNTAAEQRLLQQFAGLEQAFITQATNAGEGIVELNRATSDQMSQNLREAMASFRRESELRWMAIQQDNEKRWRTCQKESEDLWQAFDTRLKTGFDEQRSLMVALHDASTRSMETTLEASIGSIEATLEASTRSVEAKLEASTRSIEAKLDRLLKLSAALPEESKAEHSDLPSAASKEEGSEGVVKEVKPTS